VTKAGLHVVVVGHGSTKRPHAADSTHDLSRYLYDSNHFNAVHCGFMKQEMKVRTLLQCLPDGIDLEVLPHFAAAGAFVNDHLQSCLEVERKRFHSARIHRPLGLHPGISRQIAIKARHHRADDVIIVAHGSSVSTGPALTAQNLCRDLCDQGISTHVLFLSNKPHLDDWRDLDLGRNVLVCPILAGRGTHLCEDVPNAFMLDDIARPGIPYIVAGHCITFDYPLMDARLLADLALVDLCHSDGGQGAQADVNASGLS